MSKKYTVNVVPTFEKELKKLRKKYPKIIQDLKELMEDIEQNGNLGDRVQGYGDNVIYKKRMKNTSKRVGLSGGFRVIECVVRDNKVYLLDIYSKSDRVNMNKKKIKNTIKEIK